jgi:bisphosphoglycerate-independent phosphoglycerate mutase (AlkP superfamily)
MSTIATKDSKFIVRIAELEDIAHVLLFLASGAKSWITE